MTEAATVRVVLLARAGAARDRLGDALADAGAELVLAADPLSADPGDIAQARPDAVVVALEPAIEDALERFDAVLADPAVTVLFEEAELAARRAGWDAARWVRHLGAKLRRHDDVLPPGREDEGEWQPTPGPLPARADAELDLDSIAGEARTRADDVPRDENLDVVFAPLAFTDDIESAVFDDGASEDRSESVARADFDSVALVDADALFASLAGQTLDDERGADDDVASAAQEAVPPAWVGSTLSLADDDAPLATAGAAPPQRDWSDTALSLADADDATPLAPASDAPADTDWNDSGLSLADDDAPMPAVAADPQTNADDRDGALDALTERASALSLADADSYGHGPLRGAVLIEAGLGGPDAVRQLLAALPESFPRPVLVRLQLDGGRYDRLVAQMARIAKLPVALAEPGQVADAGTIYFLPGQLGLERRQGQLWFADGDVGGLLAALPDEDTAHLFLSGSQPSLVDAALAHMQSGRGLIAAQSPDTCYDAAAASALIAHGVMASAPAELAERLAERWPS